MQKMRARTLLYAAPAAIVLAACQGDLTAASIPPTHEPETTASSANPLAAFTFYIDQASKARKTANEWRATRPTDADQIEKIASQPMARWFGN